MKALIRNASYRGHGRLATWAELSETTLCADEVDTFISRNALASGSNALRHIRTGASTANYRFIPTRASFAKTFQLS